METDLYQGSQGDTGFSHILKDPFHTEVITTSSLEKAIGRGVRVKKIMLSLFERSPWEGTEASYRMLKFNCVQKLLYFEVRGFGRISYKIVRKIWNLGYFTQNVSGIAIFVRFCWNLHHSILPYRQTIFSAEFLIFWKMAAL